MFITTRRLKELLKHRESVIIENGAIIHDLNFSLEEANGKITRMAEELAQARKRPVGPYYVIKEGSDKAELFPGFIEAEAEADRLASHPAAKKQVYVLGVVYKGRRTTGGK